MLMYNEKDTMSIRRLVYDVLVYTLSKCGFPKEILPPADDKENIYKSADFLKITGAYTLRDALLMRYTWKRMFMSRLKSSGFNDEDILPFMLTVAECTLIQRNTCKLATEEIPLALGNEMIMFLYSEVIAFDFNSMIDFISCTIDHFCGSKENFLEKFELLCQNKHALEFSRWIVNFVAEFAVPYGSTEDVSKIFCLDERHYRDDFGNVLEQFKPLKDHLGFLPHEILSAIQNGEHEKLPKHLIFASNFILPGDRESPEPPAFPADSKSNVTRRWKPRRRKINRSRNAS